MIREFKKGKPTKLFQNFMSTEFDCKCDYGTCTVTYIDMDHVHKLQQMRDKLGKTIKINSGFRCVAHNRDVGGKKGSIHMTGKATDIKVVGMSVTQMAKAFEHFDGLGVYPKQGFIHCDSRGYRARWKG